MLNEFRSTYITWDKATSRIYSPVTANESDENGRKLVVQIVNSGQVEDLTGATLHLYWETRDKLHDGLDVFKAVDLKKGEFELSYTTGMLSNQGVLNANLVLIDAVGRVVSEQFKITVTEGIDNDAIQSENSFSSLTQALIDVSHLEQNYAPRLNDLTAQLEQTQMDKVGSGVKANLEDLSAEVLSAIEGGEGTSFTLLSEPQDDSVTPQKLNPQLRGDLTFLVNNEFKNADFSDGTTEWGTNSTSTIVANQNELVVTLSGTTTYSRISQSSDFIVGNKYYYAFEINPKYPNNTGIRIDSTNLEIINPEANKWSRYSSLYESDTTKNAGVWVYHTTTNGYSVGDSFKFRRMVSIDLTKSFGKGKEPTKNYMDALLNERFYNSFFTGEKNVVSLRQIFDDVSESKVTLERLETEINNGGSMSSDKQEILIENGTYWEDFTFVDGGVWGFSQSDGQPTLTSDLNIFNSDFTLKKKLKHNFGHCNSVDYNEDIDSLIFGNGGQSYETDGVMYVVQQVKSWADLPTDTLLDINVNLHGSTLTSYDFGNQFGSKINAIWSHDNLGRNDLCYVLSNDNQNIRQLLLGKGQNVLENGTAISGRLSDEFNGTYKVVSEWTLPPLTVNQGSCFYNGFVYVSLGHDGIWSARIELKSDGSSDVVERKLDYYNADGSEDVKTSAGIAVHKGKIYQGYRGGGSKLARFPIF